jgi:hypothetical protein
MKYGTKSFFYELARELLTGLFVPISDSDARPAFGEDLARGLSDTESAAGDEN